MVIKTAGVTGKHHLLVPRNEDAVLLRVEGQRFIGAGLDSAWTTSVARALAGDLAEVLVKTHYTRVHGPLGEGDGLSGELVIQRRPEATFKMVPHGDVPHELLAACAKILACPGTVRFEERKGMTIARGTLRSAAAADSAAASKHAIRLAEEEEPEPERTAAGGVFTEIIGPDQARETLRQKVVMSFLESGVKVRMIGRKADCESLAKAIIAGSPTLTTPKGAKFQIEGNLKRAFYEKAAGTTHPDADGVRTRDDPSGRTFSAFGENLLAVQAATESKCRAGTVVTIVVGNRILSAGTRKAN